MTFSILWSVTGFPGRSSGKFLVAGGSGSFIKATGSEGPSWDEAMLPDLWSACGDVTCACVRESDCGGAGAGVRQ